MTDVLEELLNLVTDTIGASDVVMGTDADGTWWLFAYWRQFECGGSYDIDVRGATLRAVLAACIADPRFGQ